jgi:hypothetical protein
MPKKDPHSHVYYSTVHNSHAMEIARCPISDEWTKNMWYIYTIEYYSTIKKNEIVLFVGK